MANASSGPDFHSLNFNFTSSSSFFHHLPTTPSSTWCFISCKATRRMPMRASVHFRHVAAGVRRVAPEARQRQVQRFQYATTTKSRPVSQSPAGSSASNHGLPVSRLIPAVLGSFVAAGIGIYTVNLFIAARKPCVDPGIVELANQKDVAARYEDTADSFDSDVGFSELLMGLLRIRKRLAQKCEGHVLEVSCGTGRNLGYYDLSPQGKVDSLTFIDLSPRMVAVCKQKWDILTQSQKPQALKRGLVVRFLAASATEEMPPPPLPIEEKQKQKYDTIFQTMGLCSTPSPVALLTNLASHLDAANPNARIILLEHGRSYLPWLNRILDNAALKHAELHGCWFNRDIGALVAEAADEAGLEIAVEKRVHFGTTWVFELVPSEAMRLKQRQQETMALTNTASEKRSWTQWLGFA